MKIKLKKILLSIILSLVLVGSSPLSVLASEAQPAPEASPAPPASSAPGASSAPEASPVTEPSPSPEVIALTPSPSPTITESSNPNNSNDEVDEDDQNLDGDEWVPIPGKDYSGNVGDTSVNSGNATASGTVINSANQSTVSTPSGCSVCAGGSDSSVTNSGNGSGSDNNGSVTSNNSSAVQIDNGANVNNDANFSAVSGDNNSSFNVGDTNIETGDSNVTGTVINSINETGIGVVEYNITEDQTGDVILLIPDGLFGCGTCGANGNLSASNVENGNDSTNDAQIDSSNSSTTDINNDADIVNSMDFVANSGDNKTSYNVGESSITTGDANVAANLLNFVNSTVSGGVAFVVNVFGDLVGDIIFPDNIPGFGGSSLTAANTGNGASSTNTSDIGLNNTNNTDIYNTADIDTNLNIDANTGGNNTNYNTGGDNGIETGDVFVNAEVLNVANLNLVGGDEPLWLLLVNNMGSWTGHIVGALTGQNYSGSEGLVFTVGDNGEIMAANQGNGADSTNNASIAQNNTNDLNINNNAKITNDINIDANTGDNSASFNTGGDSTIKTGDVNIAASIINFVNSNIIGRGLMVGIVNVFGSWTGSAVPPGQDPEPKPQQQAQGSTLPPTIVQGGSGSISIDIAKPQGGVLAALTTGSANSSNQISFAYNYNSNGDNPLFGGLINSNSDGGSANPPQGIVNGASEKPGIISLSFNYKLLMLGLLPIVLFAIAKRIKYTNAKKSQVYAHKISK